MEVTIYVVVVKLRWIDPDQREKKRENELIEKVEVARDMDMTTGSLEIGRAG